MESHDGASVPLSTLLVRLEIGDAVWPVAARCWTGQDLAALRALVDARSRDRDETAFGLLWLGDVAAAGAQPLAAALVDVDLADGAATVLAVHPRSGGEQLLQRLAVGLIEVASSRGCTTLGAAAGVVDADPGRLLHASGRAPRPGSTPPVWPLEP